MSNKLILWDIDSNPKDILSKIYLWNGYSEGENSKSLLRYIDLNGEKYRQKYIDWIENFGQMNIKDESIISYFSIDNQTSLWWLTSFVEKSPWKTPSVIDSIRLIALEDILINGSYTNFELVSPNKKLHKTLSLLCQKLNILYKWKKIKTPIKSFFSLRYFFKRLPYFFQSILTLLIHTRRNWLFRNNNKLSEENNKKSILFCSQFAHLDSRSSKFGEFYSHLWEDLPELINNKGYQINFIHHYLKSNEAESAFKAKELIGKFNLSDTRDNSHGFLFSYLSLSIVFQVLKLSVVLNFKSLKLLNIKKYFKLSNSNLNLWPIMKDNWYSDLRGPNLIINLFWLRLFDKALKDMPYQAYGLFLHENQSWERALIYAWNKYNHGHLIAVQHSTVRFWDLRYYEKNPTPLLNNNYPIPVSDTVAYNGKLAKKAYLDFGSFNKKFIECEAVRYNYLDKFRKREIKSPIQRGNKILILGDYVPEATTRMLELLESLAINNSEQYVYTIKPHPNFIVKSSEYPALNLEITMQPLVKIMDEFDIVFSGNLTSASLDAYLSGLPVIIAYDPKTFNFSPLRGQDGVFFACNSEELGFAIKKSFESQPVHPNISDFFCLNCDLPNWSKLLS